MLSVNRGCQVEYTSYLVHLQAPDSVGILSNDLFLSASFARAKRINICCKPANSLGTFPGVPETSKFLGWHLQVTAQHNAF